MNRYSFTQKTEISRRIARPDLIDRYRDLLKARRPKAATKLRTSREATAQALVYDLLDFYTEDEIVAIARISPDSLPSGGVSPFRPTPTPSVKKKPLKSKNIRISAGTIWTTLRSALLTAYSRTASTVSGVWRRLREKLQALPFWTRIFSRR